LMERRLAEISHELNPQCISNIVWGYATMDKWVRDKAMGLMERRLADISHELNPQDISNIVWGYATMNKWVGDKAMVLMEQRLEEISHELNPQHISNIVWSYATMDKRVGDKAMGLMEQRLEEISHQLNPQDISNIVWSYATMDKRVGDKAMGLMEQRLADISHQLNPQCISNIVWGYATMNKWVGDKAMVLMERRLADISHELTPHHISSIVWSYAKMNKWVRDKVTGLIEQRLEEIAHELKPPEIATLLCSYATMNKKPVEGMMGLMQGRLTQVSQECGPQVISRLLWAYGKMERSPGEQLLGLLEGRAEEICTQFTSLQIAGILWAYGRMETKMGSGLLRSLERQGEATSGVSTPSSAVLSMTMHYYGSTQTAPPPHTLAWIERVTLPSSRHLFRQDVVTLLWAYASLSICPGDLMQTLLLTEAGRLASTMDCGDLCIVLWAFASIGSWATKAQCVLESLICKCEILATRFDETQISVLIWADAHLPTRHMQSMQQRLMIDVSEIVRNIAPSRPSDPTQTQPPVTQIRTVDLAMQYEVLTHSKDSCTPAWQSGMSPAALIKYSMILMSRVTHPYAAFMGDIPETIRIKQRNYSTKRDTCYDSYCRVVHSPEKTCVTEARHGGLTGATRGLRRWLR
jgi:hypothetical protein